MENTPELADDPSPPAPAIAQHETQEFTCEICIEPMSDPDNKLETSGKCAHPFCTDCMIKYIRVKVEDDNVGCVKCPALNCDHTLDPLACAPLIGPTLFARWCHVLCEAAVSGVDRCYCPNRDCSVVVLNECGGDPTESRCPNCKELFCFRCQKLWHAGFRCDDAAEMMDVDDLALRRLAKQMGWRRCPSCRHLVERIAGCDVVKCRCGRSFCYKCGRPSLRLYCPCMFTRWGDGGIAIICLCCVAFAIYLILLINFIIQRLCNKKN